MKAANHDPAMPALTKVIIADGNNLLREGLKRLLQDAKDIQVVGEAPNDAEAMQLIEKAPPDILLLDLNIPKLEAVPLLLAIKEQNLSTQVLVMSLYPDEARILNTARAGARGYILKSASSLALGEAIREVHRGRIWVDRQLGIADNFALIAHRASIDEDSSDQTNPVDVLSKRELEILYLIGRGITNEAIAKKLFISEPTVKTHASRIFSKLNVENRTQAALLLMSARSRENHGFARQVTVEPAPQSRATALPTA